MVTVYGLVYGPQLTGFTDRVIVLRMATVYGDRVWSVYGLRNHTQPYGYFFWSKSIRRLYAGVSYADHTQAAFRPTIRNRSRKVHTRNSLM